MVSADRVAGEGGGCGVARGRGYGGKIGGCMGAAGLRDGHEGGRGENTTLR